MIVLRKITVLNTAVKKLTVALLVCSLLSNHANVVSANTQIPELTAYQDGNSVKLEWSVDIADSDVLFQTSFEPGEFIPTFIWGSYGDGGQSITTEDKHHGSRSIRVYNTHANGNWINFPSVSSIYSIMTWGRLFFPNGTPLSMTFYAKTDSTASLTPSGDGGWGKVLLDFPGVKVAEYTPAGSKTIKLTSLDGIFLGAFITTDTNPQNIVANYRIISIDNANKIITLDSGINRALSAGEQLKRRPWREAWNFKGRTVKASDGWKRFSINTFVSNYPDYDVGTRGGTFIIVSETPGKLYIDNVKFGYATEVVLYRGGQEIYRGYLSDYQDLTATDKAKPNPVSNVTASMSNGKPVLNWGSAIDNGTVYSYTIRAISRSGVQGPMSQPKTVSVTTGIKGYSIVIDTNPDTIPDNIIETTGTSYQLPTNINSNYYAHIVAVDHAGNVSDPVHVYYEDKEKPSLTVTPSTTAPTNQDVVLTAVADDAETGVKRIKNPDGEWIDGSTITYSATQNGTYTFIAEDYAGNQTQQSVHISNIDKIPPEAPVMTVEKTEPTNTDIRVYIQFPEDAVKKQYRVGLNGDWSDYVEPVVVTENTTVYARAIDAAGNASEEALLVIHNIDKTPPSTPTILHDVDVIAVIPGEDEHSGVTSTFIRINGGEWQFYTAPIQLEDGEYVIEAKTIDQAGNESYTNIHLFVYDDTLRKAQSLVENAERYPTYGKIERAREVVFQLPDVAPEKQELLDRLDNLEYQLLLEEAEKKVKQAENYLREPYVSNAIEAVNKLPDGSDKDDLLNRLDDVIKAIEGREQQKPNPEQAELDRKIKEATQKVEQAERMKREPYISQAEEVVQALPDGGIKDQLQRRLDELKQRLEQDQLDKMFEEAERKVRHAETYKREPYIRNAYDAVDPLPEGERKEALLDRLRALLTKDEGDQKPKDGQFNPGDNIVDVADSILDPVAKAAFLSWAKAIERAEKYFSRGNIVFAIQKMENIPTELAEDEKYAALYNEMSERTMSLKQLYNDMVANQELERAITKAVNAVEAYEKYQTNFLKQQAQKAVDELPDGEVKDSLQQRIDAVEEEQNKEEEN